MSHNSSISGTGEPVQAIRVINEKRSLLIMVGNNIILSCGKEYVKLASEFICKPGRENLDFLQVNKSEMTGKTKNFVCIEVLCWKVRVGVSGFLTFKNIWPDWNYKNANIFLGFKLPKRYAYWIPLYIRSRCRKNNTLSFQIKASHLHIGLKWLCQPEICRLHNSSFFSKSTHPLSDWVCIVQ